LQGREYRRKWLQKESTGAKEIVAQVREPKEEVVFRRRVQVQTDSWTGKRTIMGICTEVS
jgi:hypothetical protein